MNKRELLRVIASLNRQIDKAIIHGKPHKHLRQAHARARKALAYASAE